MAGLKHFLFFIQTQTVINNAYQLTQTRAQTRFGIPLIQQSSSTSFADQNSGSFKTVQLPLHTI